jgi:phosphoglucosamine mutase
LVDERGELVDGDAVMAILATHLAESGALKRSTIVATVMSNMGLHVSMRERGVSVVTTPVGDRHVVEEMVRGGYNLGGEQSGHIVFLDHNSTGDGLITGLAILARLIETGMPLSELRAVMRSFPQVLVNVRVREKPDVQTLPAVAKAMHAAEGVLGERGRVLVRYSGTEPLLRVMLEGEAEGQIQTLADDIATAVQSAIGAS